jgi:MoxR-like ATPase
MSTTNSNLKVGAVVYVTWEEEESAFFGFAAPALKSNIVDGIIVEDTIVPDLTVSAGLQPAAGEIWKCQVLRTVMTAGKSQVVVKPLKCTAFKVWGNSYIPPRTRELMHTVINDKQACLLAEGPHGCGKTTNMAEMAIAEGYEFEEISGGLIKDMNSMVGRLMPVVSPNGTLTVEFVPSPLVSVLLKASLPENRKKKYMLFIDEFSRIKEEPRDALLRLMNGKNKFLDLPVAPGKARSFGGKTQMILFGMFKDIFADIGNIVNKPVQSQSAVTNGNALSLMAQIFLIFCQILASCAQHVVSAMDRLIHAITQVADTPESNLTRLQMPDNVKIVAAANRGSAFTLSSEDAAHMDRWVIIKFEYMPADAELAHCLRKFPACPKELLLPAIEVVNKIRKDCNDDSLMLSKSVSTRAVENIAMLLADGHDLSSAMVVAVVNQYEGSAPLDGSKCVKDDMEAERVANYIHMALKQIANKSQNP